MGCMNEELKKECYREFRESLLNRLYDGLEPNDIHGRIVRCCEQLGIEVPKFESPKEMSEFYSSIEIEYLDRRIFVSGLPLDIRID